MYDKPINKLAVRSLSYLINKINQSTNYTNIRLDMAHGFSKSDGKQLENSHD